MELELLPVSEAENEAQMRRQTQGDGNEEGQQQRTIKSEANTDHARNMLQHMKDSAGALVRGGKASAAGAITAAQNSMQKRMRSAASSPGGLALRSKSPAQRPPWLFLPAGQSLPGSRFVHK
jgi:hypothetical protein